MIQMWRAFGWLVPIFLLVSLIIIISTLCFRGRRVKPKQLFLDILFMLSIIGVLMVTISPGALAGFQSRTINIIPFVDMYDIMFHSVHISVPIRILAFNILLFVPFGFFLSWRKCTSEKLLLNVTLKGFFLSLFVEVAQYILPLGRIANVDDLILNTFGAFLGCVMWKMLYHAFLSIGRKDMFVYGKSRV